MSEDDVRYLLSPERDGGQVQLRIALSDAQNFNRAAKQKRIEELEAELKKLKETL